MCRNRRYVEQFFKLLQYARLEQRRRRVQLGMLLDRLLGQRYTVMQADVVLWLWVGLNWIDRLFRYDRLLEHASWMCIRRRHVGQL